MQIRFSNYQPSNILAAIKYDIKTENFSFTYGIYRFESDSWPYEKALYGELIFNPQYPSIQYSDNFLSALRNDMASNCKCRVDTTKTSFHKTGNVNNTDFGRLVKIARINSD